MNKQLIIWIGALVAGALLGLLRFEWLNELFNFVATAYTRLFQFVAVPTIALAVITTLSTLSKDSGIIFRRTLVYTLLTTLASAAVGLDLYLLIAPSNLPADIVYAEAPGSPSVQAPRPGWPPCCN